MLTSSHATRLDTLPPAARAQLGIRGRPRTVTDDAHFWLHWLFGMGSALLVLVMLSIHKSGSFNADYRLLAVLAVLVSAPVYMLCAAYHPQHGALQALARLTLAWVCLLGALLALAFITKTTHTYSREVAALWAALGLCVQAVSYIGLQRVLKIRSAQQAERCRAAVIGTGPLAVELAQRLCAEGSATFTGLIDNSDHLPRRPGKFTVLGRVDEIPRLIVEHGLNRIYIALPANHSAEVKQLYLQLLDTHVDVVWMPDLLGLLLLNHAVTEIGGMPAIKLNESPLTTYPNAARLKAVMDRSLALLGLFALSPLLVLVAVLVKLSSPGPVLFRQQRHGWNGQVIEVWKFRSMRMHDDAQVRQATRNDSRITPLGRFIRRTSIDELPQLFNVLQGSMSLVGPRPHAVAHNDFYANKIQAYMARHRIKPGITGLAQISGYRGETDTLDKMQKRVELDLAYINNWSLWLDIKILIKTPFTLFGKHIY